MRETALRKPMGKRVQEARRKREISQETLAYHVGCSPNTIGSIERGIRSASNQVLYSIKQQLGVSFDYLFGEGEDKDAS